MVRFQEATHSLNTNNALFISVIDETTFGLEVTSVLFQFLAILALPWLKPVAPHNKYLMYWNYCFVPFLFIAGKPMCP